MQDFLYQIFIAFAGSIPALLLALWVERQRLPKLEIIATESANADNTYASPSSHAGERWKFFRVMVKNISLPFPFQWIPRQTAENCRAVIEFSKIGTEKKQFLMNGRWASTAEPAYMNSETGVILRILYPDPVTIAVSESEYLDVIVKNEEDSVAYGWNNESYLNDWRTQKHLLERGKYEVKIVVATQNGVSFSEKFTLAVADTIENTSITRAT